MPRKNIGFTKPPEPSFITRMKIEAGYKEGPSVNTKREGLAAGTPDDLDDRGDDDEAPTVVVLRDGDLSADEFARELERSGPAEKEAEEETETGGRIIFRKPTKRDASGAVAVPEAAGPAERLPAGATGAEPSSKRSRDTSDDKPSSGKSKSRPKQNTKLLSFQQDDEEEED